MSWWKWTAIVVGGVLAAVLGYLLLWPVPIDAEAWQAPAFDARDWTTTGRLEAERVPLPEGHGPEDLAVDARGRIHAGLHDGRILRWSDPDAAPEVLVDTGGRPLGLHWGQRGRLLVADAWKGLLAVDHRGDLEVLTTTCGGEPLVFTDDLDTTHDGRIWFTDATVRFRQPAWKLDLLENRPSGRLCVYDPGTGETREVLDDLYFANGVAVDPRQQFVLVVETARYRVRRVWIAGPRAGDHEILIDNLPGFPDGISTGSHGRYWLALASPRNPAIDAASARPWLREAMVRLPSALQPAPARTARVMAIDAEGRVLHDLFDPTGDDIAVVTSVQERGGRLYLGSLVDDAWARAPVPTPPRE